PQGPRSARSATHPEASHRLAPQRARHSSRGKSTRPSPASVCCHPRSNSGSFFCRGLFRWPAQPTSRKGGCKSFFPLTFAPSAPHAPPLAGGQRSCLRPLESSPQVACQQLGFASSAFPGLEESDSGKLEIPWKRFQLQRQKSLSIPTAHSLS